MAITEEGEVQTLLPTAVGWGCTGQGFRSSPYLATVFTGAIGDKTPIVELDLNKTGKISLDGRELRDDHWVSHLMGIVVIHVELPIRIDLLQKTIADVVRSDELMGLVIRPKPDAPWRPIELAPEELEKLETHDE